MGHSMDAIVNPAAIPPDAQARPPADMRMSYKFHACASRSCAAVASGEFSGKLPGERALARRFDCNAKTLSKALTDLASEGLLDRSIGRGTYVRGTAPRSESLGRWLLLCEPEGACGDLAAAIQAMNADATVVTDARNLRPSFLNQFSAVVIVSCDAPDQLLRDLSVRSMPVVLVNREPGTFSHHAVVIDASLAGARLGRELLLAGHRRIGVIEPRGSSALIQSIRRISARYSADAVVDTCEVEEMASLIENGFTALVAASAELAVRAKASLLSLGISVPGQVSLAAVGCVAGPPPCSGYFASPRQIAESVAGLLRDGQPTRPAALWLAGQWQDAGTLGTGEIVPLDIDLSHLRGPDRLRSRRAVSFRAVG